MEFRLLGRMEALHDGAPVALGRRRERMLLALLLLQTGKAVPVDRLAALLWDDDRPTTARASLHTHVSRLRALLGPLGVQLLSASGGYRVDVPPQDIDVHVFRTLVNRAASMSAPEARVELLRTALRLWRGPLLDDITTEPVRQRLGADLTELRLAATESLMAAELARGRHREIIGELTALVADSPARERFTAQLMLALYRCGRRTEALDVYERTRALLAEELGLDPGIELQELRTGMLRDDPRLAPPGDGTAGDDQAGDHAVGDHPAADGTRAVAGPVPAQLPLPVSQFTGRSEALLTLDEQIRELAESPTTVAVTVIIGTGGAGKTALAVTWAHRVVDRFPDGQLYVNLRGHDQGEPKSPAAALDGFLRALGVERTPTDLDERASLYRSLLARRKMLIILDNARSAEQVRPLLPGSPGSLVLVTSRNDLPALAARDGARTLQLDRLTDAEATDLLRRLLGADRVDADPATRAELVRICAGLPLALRVAAERAGPARRLPLADLVADLADRTRRLDMLSFPGDPLTALRVVFSWSYQALPAPAARLFRLLGLHPAADWDVYSVANLAGLDLDATGGLLDLLASAHLIEPGPAGRFQMHDLLREYAAERAAEHAATLPTGAADRPLDRLYDWYLHTVNHVMDLVDPYRSRAPLPESTRSPVTPPITDYGAAIEWLTAERLALVAAVERAGDRLVPAWQIPQALWKFFFIRGHIDDWVGTHEIALAAARRLDDPFAEGEILNSLGASCYAIGRYAEAVERYREALPLRRRAGDRHGEAVTLGNIGVAYDLMGRYAEAIEHYLAALPIRRAVGDRRGEAMTLGNLGISLKAIGRYADAIEHYRTALATYRAIDDQRGAAVALDNLGVLADRLGRSAEALALLAEALDLGSRHDDSRIVAYVHNHLGSVHLRFGDPDDARRAYERALALAREIGNREAEATALAGLGRVHTRLGQSASALDLLGSALDLARRLSNPSREGEVGNDLGDARLAADEPEAALGHHRAALALVERNGDRYQLGRAELGIARALRRLGDPDTAREHASRAAAILGDLGVPEAAEATALLREAPDSGQ